MLARAHLHTHTVMGHEPHESAPPPGAATSRPLTAGPIQPGFQQPAPEHTKRKGWRQTPHLGLINSPATPKASSEQPSHDCIIELSPQCDNSQARTSLVAEAPLGAPAPAPTAAGPQIRRWLSRSAAIKHFKSSLHTLARRLSWCLAKVESGRAHSVPPDESREPTYSIYLAVLSAESFKRAIGLLLLTSCAVLLHLIQAHKLHQMPWLTCYTGLLVFSNYTHRLLYKRAVDKRLAENNLQPAATKRQHPAGSAHPPTSALSNAHILDSLRFLVLHLSVLYFVICILLNPPLGPLMAIIVFIFYTQLAINSPRLVVLVCLPATLLALIPLTSHQDHSWILVSVICFAVFYVQGLLLNHATASQCLKSFSDIKSCEQAKSLRIAEGKKLTKLLQGAYPRDLVGEIRDHKLGAVQQHNQFQPFYFRSYQNVSILYADIVHFTDISSRCSPKDLVEVLHELVGRFDREAEKYPCLRIKILGDCYYCVSGMPDSNERHAHNCVEMALDMIDILHDMANTTEMVSRFNLKMRVGIHSGRVICGVLGNKKKQFDVYSDDVRLANLLEQSGVPGRVHISERTLRALGGSYEVEPAHDNLRGLYSHLQEDVGTYFVKQPADRPKLISANTVTQSTSRFGARGSRFKKAANCVKTVKIFIRPIEYPFANLVSSYRSDSMSDNSSVTGSASIAPETKPKPRERAEEAELRRTIEQRCLDSQSCDVNPLTLRFKSANNTYKTSYSLKRIMILAFSIPVLFVLTIVYKHTSISLSELELTSMDAYVYIILYLVVSLIHWHQQEFLARRDFRWRQVAIKYKDRLEKLQECNRSILYDLLPRHVASYFLDQQIAGSIKDLYCKSYTCTGVLFGNICNFYQYYDEKLLDRGGLECLRVLNEIICDFDAILDEPQFEAIDKIKTIGATYMAAIGLLPNHEMPEYRIRRPSTVFVGVDSSVVASTGPSPPASPAIRRQVALAMRTLAMFEFKMRERLDEIGHHAFFKFNLKSGINLGPVTAGVIAASKPQYDIWGNTVNVASRMESTAEPNKLQITEDVYELMVEFNPEPQFEFTCRGPQKIKGKGLMTTYYLDMKSSEASGGAGGGGESSGGVTVKSAS